MKTKMILDGRYEVYDDGRIYSWSTKRFIKPGLNSSGYLTVCLYDGSKPKKPRSYLVHRLVAKCFFGNSDLQVNHIDGNKQNNALHNLEYCDQLENFRHAVAVLGINLGTRNGNNKLSKEQVDEIRNHKGTSASIARRMGISERHASDIRNGKYWKWHKPDSGVENT